MRETYAEYLRTADPETLSDAEREILIRDQAWADAFPEEAALLESLVGRRVTLQRRMKTHYNDVPEEQLTEYERTYLQRLSHVDGGTSFIVRMRVHDRVLAEDQFGFVYLLRIDWLNSVRVMRRTRVVRRRARALD